MMKNILHISDRDGLISRLENLTPENSRLWGSMSPLQVLPHLTDPFRVAIGDRQAVLMDSMFSKWPVSPIVVWLMPWPKAAPTADEFIQGKKGTPPVNFDHDKQTLLLSIHRFVNHPAKEPFNPSPVFGPLSRRAWGRLMWRHMDHHLRQFGI